MLAAMNFDNLVAVLAVAAAVPLILASVPRAPVTSLTRFTRSCAYGVTHLRGDLARFAYLLGADGSQLFTGM